MAKRILYVSDGIFPFSVGGMQQHSTKMVSALLDNGVHVDLFHTVLNSKKPEEKEVEQLFSSHPNLNLDFVEFPSSLKIPGHYVRSSKAYSQRVFRSIEPSLSSYDVIYTQGFTGYAFLNNRYGTPVISNLHGLEMFQRSADVKSKLKNILLQPIAKHILKKSDVNISLGGKLTQLIEKNAGRKDNIWKMPNFIDTRWINNKERYFNDTAVRKVLFIGRYERRKGIEELFNVIRLFPDIEFHFVGQLPKHSLENVFFHGKVTDHKKMISIIDDCEALICPSYSEGMPTVILEAMARGLAVIATDVGAVSELVDQQNGWLLPNADESNIEKALHSFSSSTTLLDKQKNSMIKVRQFTTEVVVASFVSKINEYLSHRKN